MTLAEEAGLKDGQTLVNHTSREEGFMGNIDVDDYDIADSDGKIIGCVHIKLHTNVKSPYNISRDFQVHWNK